MSALLENAITWHEISTEYFNKFIKNSEETRYLRACCYHMQQTAEFSIKGTLELLGKEYSAGHDLEENGEQLIAAINEAAQESMVFSPLKSIINDIQWLVDKSGIIIKWEQKPRYDGENFFAKEENVRKCKECLDNIISVVSEFINPVT